METELVLTQPTPIVTLPDAGAPLHATLAEPAAGRPEPAVVAADSWQARHAGLQRVMNETLTKTGWQRLDAIPHAAEVERWRADAAQLATVQQQLAQVENARQTAEVERGAALTNYQRLQVLALQAPELIHMERYIAGNTADEVAASIAQVRQDLAKATTHSFQPVVAVVPPSVSPAAATPLTRAELTPLLRAAQDERRWEDYRSLTQQFVLAPG